MVALLLGYRAFYIPTKTFSHTKFLTVQRVQYTTRSRRNGNHLCDTDIDLPIAYLTERDLSFVLGVSHAQEFQRGDAMPLSEK
jgi:hypothetical protein